MPKKNYLSELLNRLLFERKMKPIDLCRDLDIPQPTVHRIITGKCANPHSKNLEPIAAYFNLSCEQLKGDEPLPKGAFNNTDLIDYHGLIEIPIVAWDALCSPIDTSQATQHIVASKSLSKNCFACTMEDSSMEPQFPKDAMLIFDPKQPPTDRSFVLIRLHDTKLFIFRQLLIDAEHQFLKPLNLDLNHFQMRLLEKHDIIVAKLVEARQVFKEY